MKILHAEIELIDITKDEKKKFTEGLYDLVINLGLKDTHISVKMLEGD